MGALLLGLLWPLAVVGQIALALLALAATVHFVRSGIAGARLPSASASASTATATATDTDTALPFVTVQLPMRNERAVAARVIRAAAALDWPVERIEIQVLDDSDDDTRAIVDDAVAEVGAAGHAAMVVRRQGRAGYKAGALAHGLGSARGEYLLVLDADSQPEPDLVRRLMAALLADPTLAFVQARWSFDNARTNLLTRAQALILDGLMVVEQPLLGARGLPVQFNGTAGIWRRSALESAGGWVAASDGDAGSSSSPLDGSSVPVTVSVTEDLDISFRARLAGFRGRTLPEISVRTELPSTMAVFRAQQQRWVRGGAEVLRGLAGRLARGTIPARERVTMLAHLARHGRQPVLVLAALWLPLSTLGRLELPLSRGPLWPALVGALLGAVALYYGVARWRLGAGPLRSIVEPMLLAPAIVALSMGMSLLLTVAFLRGFLVAARAEFVRTPKAGGYRAPVDPLAVAELAIGLWVSGAAVVAVANGAVVAGVGLAALVGAGYLWVGLGSLADR